MSIDNREINIVPCRQGIIGMSTIQEFSERGPVQVTEKGSLVKMFERSKWYIWMGFGLTFWKLNRSWTGDGTMVTYAQVRYTDLGDYVWVVCIYIWSIRVADVCVILVGDFTSWVKPSSVIVESQEECGFSKSILKSPSTRNISMGFNSMDVIYHLYKVVKPFIRSRRVSV